LWTHGQFEFAILVNNRGDPIVAKRRLGSDAWETFDLADIPGNPLGAPTEADLHNDYVIGVDGKGFIHVVGNMHAEPLRYVRSTRPLEIDSWTAATMTGMESDVTYPAFVELRDGTLLFWCREGYSGNGDILVNRLDEESQQWHRVTRVIDGTSNNESAYLQHIAVGRDGSLDVMYVWRSTGAVATNNDISYAESKDGGATWTKVDGTPLALPLTHASGNVVVDTPPVGSGLSNAGGFEIDAKGRPHGIFEISGKRGARLLLHVWYDGRRWRSTRLSTPLARGMRPSLVTTPDGGVFALGSVPTGHGYARVVVIDLNRSPRCRALTPLLDVPGGWEVTFDTQRLNLDGSLSILVPSVNSASGGSAAGSSRDWQAEVLTYRLSDTTSPCHSR
jgi:hypothetical protein